MTDSPNPKSCRSCRVFDPDTLRCYFTHHHDYPGTEPRDLSTFAISLGCDKYVSGFDLPGVLDLLIAAKEMVAYLDAAGLLQGHGPGTAFLKNLRAACLR